MGSAGETVMSEATLLALSTPVETIRLDEQLVKGRDTPVVAFKILALQRSTNNQQSNGHVMTPTGAQKEGEAV
jgi:hypothetical protein